MPAAAAACHPLLLPLCYTVTPTASITPSTKLFDTYLNDYKAPPPNPMLTLNRGTGKTRPTRVTICHSSSSASSANCNITDFDLYELMGIDSTCDRSEIKTAYRTLQKRCHPDIAGPAGHDMAIILNEAYALLSDPNSRTAYDKEQAKTAQLRGYTGKPIYSEWFGSESEERAVFVDEVKCIGCLKCALCAENTFAIESVYGRARAVGQWADPESKIQQAIQACPVDCISMVERSDLAALEFLMSKQPRGSVRIGMGNTAGTRVSNIFVDVKKFQTSIQDARGKAAAAASSTQTSSETDLQREARLSAIQAIRSISNWLHWKTPSYSDQSTSLQNFTQLGGHKSKGKGPNIDKLRDAAATRKQGRNGNQSKRRVTVDEEYWIPLTDALPTPAASSSSITSSCASAEQQQWKQQTNVDKKNHERRKLNPIRLLAPMGPAILMATVVAGRFNIQGGGGGGDGGAVGIANISNVGLKEHIYGSLALEIVNSSWLQIILAAITWYIIGVVIMGLADAIKSRQT